VKTSGGNHWLTRLVLALEFLNEMIHVTVVEILSTQMNINMTIGDSSGSRLVDYTKDAHSRNCTGILCSLTSGVVWISDNGILDGCAEDDSAVSFIFNGTIDETSSRDKGPSKRAHVREVEKSMFSKRGVGFYTSSSNLCLTRSYAVRR
jgi:hypothetical protein